VTFGSLGVVEKMESDIIKVLRQSRSCLEERFGVKRIAVFGSFAKGRSTEDSDVDIVVEFKHPIGLKFMELAEYLEKLLCRKVDILTLEGIKAIRVKRVADEIKGSLHYV